MTSFALARTRWSIKEKKSLDEKREKEEEDGEEDRTCYSTPLRVFV